MGGPQNTLMVLLHECSEWVSNTETGPLCLDVKAVLRDWGERSILQS